MRYRLLCTLLLMALAFNARGGRWEPLQNIRQAAEAYVALHVAQNAEVSAAALDPRVQLPACEGALKSDAASVASRGAQSVEVRCDSPAWKLYVPVRIRETHWVLVARRALARGERLTPDLFQLESRDAGTLGYGYLDDASAISGKALRRPLPAGAVLTPDLVEAQRAVRRGERVTLIGRAGSVEVRTQGKALADGADGDSIAVENANSRRVVQGIVRGAGVVEVLL